ncbi:hypothetical protein MNEG_0334 [Monoraphidium neglectum]|uniref:Uncharacterized protein n=1 Tax=Monoraphidium neglectum TaxID=145388 RepID=A0A0D2LMX6_9CHLO|nr:hypothetical protein MNEG_0334 [Monoraphidium neglectum]KIZ07619.1 hypothetical protein MNEG_0334 [Monoraphidium neglectum]|eukprot:XP_013906638.1 hypothetical protein MNEG_0334 [Monoraphidium neglectum]
MMLQAQKQVALGSRQAARRNAAVAPLRAPRSSGVCRAEPTPDSVQEGSGYVAYDSAGQSNMYPVMTKAYADNGPNATTEANTGFALFAGAVAVGAIAVAVGLLSIKSGGADTTADQFKALSEYASIFAAQI